MIFEQIPVGGDRNFSYLIGDEAGGEAAVVDCGYNAQLVADTAAEHDLQVKWIIATHSDYDHIDAIPKLKEMTGAQVAAHHLAADKLELDKPLDDGDTLSVGSIELRMIHCPGHCRDSIAILVDGQKLCSGDELFVGKIGGTSTEQQARQQYENLQGKLMKLDDQVEVYPGHDVGSEPSSTIGRERQTNPFLTRESFEDFLWLKNNWAQYKAEHGIA
jgi:glyoxylase-like metal-dependent hydrolase (beta-lactamase superfamily II)